MAEGEDGQHIYPQINTHTTNNGNYPDTSLNTNRNAASGITTTHSCTYNCDTCKIEFNRKLDYVLHVRSSHTSTEKFKCDLCIKICTNYPALMRHKIMAHSGTRREFSWIAHSFPPHLPIPFWTRAHTIYTPAYNNNK